MAHKKSIEHAPSTIAFEGFWTWLQAHPNCIIRAGTPEAILYDDEDLHWHFSTEATGTLVVQVMRGKKLVGEIFVVPNEVTYVQGLAGEEDEYVFELISETETDRVVSCYVVLSHDYDAQEALTPGRAVH